MEDKMKKVVARCAVFGGIVLITLGLFLAWAAYVGMGSGGDWAYFSVLLLLGICMVGQAFVIWSEVRAGGPTDKLDLSMISIQSVVVVCLIWLFLNVDRVQIIQITNGEVHFSGVPEEMATVFFLLMLFTTLDVSKRLKGRTERATLNTAPRSTGPDTGP